MSAPSTTPNNASPSPPTSETAVSTPQATPLPPSRPASAWGSTSATPSILRSDPSFPPLSPASGPIRSEITRPRIESLSIGKGRTKATKKSKKPAADQTPLPPSPPLVTSTPRASPDAKEESLTPATLAGPINGWYGLEKEESVTPALGTQTPKMAEPTQAETPKKEESVTPMPVTAAPEPSLVATSANRPPKRDHSTAAPVTPNRPLNKGKARQEERTPKSLRTSSADDDLPMPDHSIKPLHFGGRDHRSKTARAASAARKAATLPHSEPQDTVEVIDMTTTHSRDLPPHLQTPLPKTTEPKPTRQRYDEAGPSRRWANLIDMADEAATSRERYAASNDPFALGAEFIPAPPAAPFIPHPAPIQVLMADAGPAQAPMLQDAPQPPPPPPVHPVPHPHPQQQPHFPPPVQTPAPPPNIVQSRAWGPNQLQYFLADGVYTVYRAMHPSQTGAIQRRATEQPNNTAFLVAPGLPPPTSAPMAHSHAANLEAALNEMYDRLQDGDAIRVIPLRQANDHYSGFYFAFNLIEQERHDLVGTTISVSNRPPLHGFAANLTLAYTRLFVGIIDGLFGPFFTPNGGGDNIADFVTNAIMGTPVMQEAIARNGPEQRDYMCTMYRTGIFLRLMPVRGPGNIITNVYAVYIETPYTQIDHVYTFLATLRLQLNRQGRLTHPFLGVGILNADRFRCSRCLASDHPATLCPFPNLPEWDGVPPIVTDEDDEPAMHQQPLFNIPEIPGFGNARGGGQGGRGRGAGRGGRGNTRGGRGRGGNAY
ncbi:unnamed protein product [Peniophora sp. CBMAI 1063]|nr:unnamed protein product [Peniophora sp. CBMAI 1063]